MSYQKDVDGPRSMGEKLVEEDAKEYLERNPEVKETLIRKSGGMELKQITSIIRQIADSYRKNFFKRVEGIFIETSEVREEIKKVYSMMMGRQNEELMNDIEALDNELKQIIRILRGWIDEKSGIISEEQNEQKMNLGRSFYEIGKKIKEIRFKLSDAINFDEKGDIERIGEKVERLVFSLYHKAIGIFAEMGTVILSSSFDAMEAKKNEKKDEMTGVLTKRSFIDRLGFSIDNLRTLRRREDKLAAEIRENPFLSLLVIDIDNFKKINDTYGHLAGDNVIKEVVKRFNVRGGDFIGRFGGEEFMLLISGDAKKATIVANRILKDCADHPFIINDNQGKRHEISVTVSVGIAQIPNEDFLWPSVQDLINIADHEMYRSKMNGRNSVYYNGECVNDAGNVDAESKIA